MYLLFSFSYFLLPIINLCCGFSQQTDIRVQVIRLGTMTKFEVKKFDGRNEFSLWCI